MTLEFLTDLSMQTLHTAVLLATAPLLGGVLIGVVISIFQSVAQSQEQTLVQVPKMFAVVLIIMAAMPWMLELLLNYTSNLFIHLPDFVR